MFGSQFVEVLFNSQWPIFSTTKSQHWQNQQDFWLRLGRWNWHLLSRPPWPIFWTNIFLRYFLWAMFLGWYWAGGSVICSVVGLAKHIYLYTFFTIFFGLRLGWGECDLLSSRARARGALGNKGNWLLPGQGFFFKIDFTILLFLFFFLFSSPVQINRWTCPLLAPAPLTSRVFTTLQSDPRDLWPLRHLIRQIFWKFSDFWTFFRFLENF